MFMTEVNGHRWLKFWPQDWMADPGLQSCSLAAQGLWIRLLCVMHDATPRGHLLINGLPPTSQQISKIIGKNLEEIRSLLLELKRAKVYSRDGDGVIFSRRMVRDTAASEYGKRTGKLGGNPILRRGDNSQRPLEGLTGED